MAKRKQAVRQNDEEVTVAATAHVHADAVNAGHMSAKRQKLGRKGPESNATAKMRGPASRQAPSKEIKPSLLGLPAELRNEIYRYALVEGEITIGLAGLVQPGILRTCQQMRCEASGIYYQENNFTITIINLRSLVPARHWLINAGLDEHRILELRGGLNWSNLNAWLRDYHEADRYLKVLWNGDDGWAQYKAVGNAFEIVDLMLDLPWSRVEAVLEKFREGLRATSYGSGGWKRHEAPHRPW